jgi:glycyl-tRNA synthetase
MPATSLEQVVSLAKRRGFVFPGSDIYGGLANSWDYGPLGVELKNNIQQLWWKHFVQMRDDMVGIDAAIIMNPKVWEASGHVSGFTDPLVECKKCHQRFREDQIEGECPNCGNKEFSEAKQFNLLFPVRLGASEETSTQSYLRGEIAQAMFVNFKNVIDSTRVKLPFGIASQGKAFRNEITPGNFIFRTREFDLMEFEYFIKESDWKDVFEMWKKEMNSWIKMLGINSDKVHELEKTDLAHYSKRTVDLEYDYPFGREELYGLAYRTDFDLKNHMEKSGQDLMYTDPDSGEKFLPHVVEPTFGLNRTVLAVLCDAYTEEEERTVLKLHPRIAPYKVAVFPLLKNKPELVEKARGIYNDLKKHFNVAWDERGNIGKRYFAQDEIGTPFCVTVDFETIENGDETVTIRHRDSMKQERIKIADLHSFIEQSFSN